jgi:hypothetical protein
MQTLVLEIATTFADDALALVKGSGRVAMHIVTAPVERLAKACDVAGVLSQRTSFELNSPNRPRRRSRWFRSPFRSLSELT